MVLRLAGGGKCREWEGRLGTTGTPLMCQNTSLLLKTSYMRYKSQESRGQNHEVRTQADCNLQLLSNAPLEQSKPSEDRERRRGAEPLGSVRGDVARTCRARVICVWLEETGLWGRGWVIRSSFPDGFLADFLKAIPLPA